MCDDIAYNGLEGFYPFALSFFLFDHTEANNSVSHFGFYFSDRCIPNLDHCRLREVVQEARSGRSIGSVLSMDHQYRLGRYSYVLVWFESFFGFVCNSVLQPPRCSRSQETSGLEGHHIRSSAQSAPLDSSMVHIEFTFNPQRFFYCFGLERPCGWPLFFSPFTKTIRLTATGG